MMNKKMMALLLAVATISTSMFAFLDDVLHGAGAVATAPIDAAHATVDPNTTYGELREERYGDWRNRRERRQDRRERQEEMRDDRYYGDND